MYRLLETIRIENQKAENLDLHIQRMERSAKALWGVAPPGLIEELDKQTLPKCGVFKCSVRYDIDKMDIRFEAYTTRPVKSLKLINADSLEYGLKYSDRSAIDTLFMLRANADDVLFIKNGYITDTSYANIALLKRNKWFTPSKPLLKGTMRELLLQEMIIEETDINHNDIKEYEKIRLINAMMPWDKGPVVRIENVIL